MIMSMIIIAIIINITFQQPLDCLFLSIGMFQLESFQIQGIPNDVDTSMIIITIMSMIMIIIVIIITFEPRNCISASILAPPNKSVCRFQGISIQSSCKNA